MDTNDREEGYTSSETCFKTATDLEVLRRSHAFLVKVIAGVSISAIAGLVAIVYIMQTGQAKAIASAVNAMARVLK